MEDRDTKQDGEKVQRIDMPQYRKKFGLPPSDDDSEKLVDADKAKAALEHALDIRKFEIQLYWQRATYFWAFIAAAFAGFAAIQTISNDYHRTYLSILISCIGTLFSAAWYCVNRGSKYWQENWENHVDLLEDRITGPLYKTVVSRPSIADDFRSGTKFRHIAARIIVGPMGYSTSKINQLISLFTVIFWFILLCHVTPMDFSGKLNYSYAILIIIMGFGVLAIFILGRTEGDALHDNLRATLRSSRIGDNIELEEKDSKESVVVNTSKPYLTLSQSIKESCIRFFSVESAWNLAITIGLLLLLELSCLLADIFFPKQHLLSEEYWLTKGSSDIETLRYLIGSSVILTGMTILLRTIWYKSNGIKVLTLKSSDYLVAGSIVAIGFLVVYFFTSGLFSAFHWSFLWLLLSFSFIALLLYMLSRLPLDIEIKSRKDRVGFFAIGLILFLGAGFFLSLLKILQ